MHHNGNLTLKRYLNMQKNILTEQEAAHYIGMSRSFLRHKRCEGFLSCKQQGPNFIKIGRAVRYARQDLDAWLIKNRISPTMIPY